MSNTAMSTAAMAQSSIAMQQAHEAQVRSCKGYIEGYHAETATVEQMQEYAKCVSLVHPSPMGGTEILAIKIILVIAFIGLATGVWKALNGHCNSLLDVMLYGILGFLVLPAIAAITFGIGYAFLWLVGVV